MGLAANKCPAYAKAVDSAVLCKAAANALGFEYRDQNRSDLPKGCGRLVAGATNVFWNDHPVGQASATYAFVCSTGAPLCFFGWKRLTCDAKATHSFAGAYSAGPAGAGSCATGLRAVDSALQCESAAAQLGYRWQSNSLMKDATRPLGCSAIPTTDNSNAAFWNVGINAKGAPASNASPICLPATAGTRRPWLSARNSASCRTSIRFCLLAAPSQSELIVGFVLAKADLKKSATPSTKQMIIKVGGTQPSAGLTEGIRNKLATHLEVDPSRVVADVKATSKETVITVSLRTDPFADANATVRPNAQLLALGKITPQALATLLDRTPLGRTCTVSLYRDEDFGTPLSPPVAAYSAAASFACHGDSLSGLLPQSACSRLTPRPTPLGRESASRRRGCSRTASLLTSVQSRSALAVRRCTLSDMDTPSTRNTVSLTARNRCGRAMLLACRVCGRAPANYRLCSFGPHV